MVPNTKKSEQMMPKMAEVKKSGSMVPAPPTNVKMPPPPKSGFSAVTSS